VKPEIAAKALVNAAKHHAMTEAAASDPAAFWAKEAGRVAWMTPPTKIKNVDFTGPVTIKWFEDGVLNASVSCLDRHLATKGDQVAIIWEGDDPNSDSKVTYRQLHEQVCRLANGLRALGVKKGDRVCIYLPMIVEAAVAMLACARVGAVHSIVFGGFSPDSLSSRIQDSECKVLITADEGRRGGRKVALKTNADEALQRMHAVANAPINGIFQHQLGMGIVGGRLYQAELEGVEAAHLAVRILHGEPASSIPPKIIGPLPPRYDWRELRRWNIDEKRLQPGSTVSEALSLFGEIRGFELVETKLVGSALRRYTFLSFGRDFPLRWRFYFYRTEKAWRLIDLHVDDRLAGIFEVTGPFGQMSLGFPQNYGFTAIIVAFLGRLNPLGVILAGIVLAITYIGGDLAQSVLQLPNASKGIFQAMMLFFLLASDILIRYRVKFVSSAPAPSGVAARSPAE